MFQLAARTLPLFAVIVGVAMALGAYMNYAGVRSAYLDQIQSRLQMVLDDVGVSAESAVSVGIPPAEQVTLAPLLARLAGADPLIVSLDVVAPDDTVLFSSDPERIGDPTTQGPGVAALDRPVRNDFGARVASVVLRYDRRTVEQSTDSFGAAVLADALPAGLLAALAASLAAFAVLRGLHRRAERAADRLVPDTLAEVEREVGAFAEPDRRDAAS